jgi:hypothetical protein
VKAEIKIGLEIFRKIIFVKIYPPASKPLSRIPIWFTVKATRWKPESPMSEAR